MRINFDHRCRVVIACITQNMNEKFQVILVQKYKNFEIKINFFIKKSLQIQCEKGNAQSSAQIITFPLAN